MKQAWIGLNWRKIECASLDSSKAKIGNVCKDWEDWNLSGSKAFKNKVQKYLSGIMHTAGHDPGHRKGIVPKLTAGQWILGILLPVQLPCVRQQWWSGAWADWEMLVHGRIYQLLIDNNFPLVTYYTSLASSPKSAAFFTSLILAVWFPHKWRLYNCWVVCHVSNHASQMTSQSSPKLKWDEGNELLKVYLGG